MAAVHATAYVLHRTPDTAISWASADGQPRAWLQLWQVLPLVPPEDTYWSPYSGLDALCGNPLLIDLEDLVTRGLLDPKDLPARSASPSHPHMRSHAKQHLGCVGVA